MKMVSTLPSSRNWKRINVPLASFAGGLALATVAVIGGGEILRDNGNTVSLLPETRVESRSIGAVMDEPDFRLQPARVAAQPIGPVMDEPDFGPSGIEAPLAQQEALTTSAAALQDARGIGQPGEGARSAEATLIDPTDFGSLGIESALQQSAYPPVAPVDYSLPTTFVADFFGSGQSDERVESAGASDALLFGTMVDGVYVIESDMQIP